MSSIPPSIPFKLANAYGVQPIRVKPIAQPPAAQAAAPANSQTKPQRGADSLLAGSTGTSINFDAQQTPPEPGKLAFYRHPADTNAAATAIDLGRSLDVQG